MSVSVEGLAVTPKGRPEMVTETVPVKELTGVAAMVTALLVLPALIEIEPGETAREKSGEGWGGGLPQVVISERAIRAAMIPSTLAKFRM